MLSWSGCFAMTSSDGALEQMMLMPHPLGLLAPGQSDRSLVADRPAAAAHLPVAGHPALPGHEDLSGRGGHPDLGTRCWSLLGAVGVALTAGLRGKGRAAQPTAAAALYSGADLRHLPAIDAASMGLPYAGQLAILGAMLVGAVTLTPGHLSGAAGQRQLINLVERPFLRPFWRYC